MYSQSQERDWTIQRASHPSRSASGKSETLSRAALRGVGGFQRKALKDLMRGSKVKVNELESAAGNGEGGFLLKPLGLLLSKVCNNSLGARPVRMSGVLDSFRRREGGGSSVGCLVRENSVLFNHS